MRTVLLIISLMVILLLGGTVWFFLGETFVNLWLFWGIILFVSVGTGLILGQRWSKVTKVSNFALNLGVHVVVFALFIAAAVLIVNYTTANLDSVPETKVLVEKKYTKTRYRSKRVTRKTYTRGEPYKVYFIDLEIPHLGERSFEVPRKVYTSLSTGDTATVRLGRGLLGLPVLDASSASPQ